MKIKLLIFLGIILVSSLVFVSSATIRDGSCNADETCLLSMFQENNSHIGECNYYNYSLCYSGSKTINLREGDCSSGEKCILSQYKQNNSHVGRCNYYNYSLCIAGSWNVNLTNSSCSGGLITFFQENNSHVGSLNYYNYTLCLEEIITPVGGEGGPSTSGPARSRRESYECMKDDDCREDYVCYDHKCVKLFDVKILKVDSPIQPRGFFSFTYYLKGMADFSNDVIVDFWLDKNGERVTSGTDTIYLGYFEEKTETTELYLPKNVADGVYNFYIEVSFGGYKAISFRVIEIEGKEIRLLPESKFKWIYILYLILIIIIVFLVYWLAKKFKLFKKKRKKSKRKRKKRKKKRKKSKRKRKKRKKKSKLPKKKRKKSKKRKKPKKRVKKKKPRKRKSKK